MKLNLKQKAEALFSQYNQLEVGRETFIVKTVGREKFHLINLVDDEVIEKRLTHLEVVKFFDEMIMEMREIVANGLGHFVDTPETKSTMELFERFDELKKEHPFDSDEWNF